MTFPPLTTTDHNRTVAGLRYIYPVMSRRAGGLSIGINLNSNNACNWRCIYCQVPNLITGSAPPLDNQLLAKELRFFLNEVLHGNFYDAYQVPVEQRVIQDMAISGNGEPTSLKNFAEAVGLIAEIGRELKVLPASRYIVISNGSLTHLPQVQQGLKVLAQYHGELWFKLDSGTNSGKKLINQAAQTVEAGLNNLILAQQCCTTKIQTCLINYDNQGLSSQEAEALLTAFKFIKANTNIDEVMLYTIARQSHQPQAPLLTPLTAEVMHSFAASVRHLGFNVIVSY